MDPVAIANLAALGVQIFTQIYNGMQQANADKVKPLADILAAANAIDDAGIAAAQAEIARLVHLQDKANGLPVPLPGLLAKKYPRAPFAQGWAFLFPSKEPCRYEGTPWRYRIHESAIQRAFKAGVQAAGVSDDLTPHHLRHAWATHMAHRPGVSLRDVQAALGHRQLETTAGYITPEVDRLPDALAGLPGNIVFMPGDGMDDHGRRKRA